MQHQHAVDVRQITAEHFLIQHRNHFPAAVQRIVESQQLAVLVDQDKEKYRKDDAYDDPDPTEWFLRDFLLGQISQTPVFLDFRQDLLLCRPFHDGEHERHPPEGSDRSTYCRPETYGEITQQVHIIDDEIDGIPDQRTDDRHRHDDFHDQHVGAVEFRSDQMGRFLQLLFSQKPWTSQSSQHFAFRLFGSIASFLQPLRDDAAHGLFHSIFFGRRDMFQAGRDVPFLQFHFCTSFLFSL
ncbi:hypothetical protein SDC9_109932 [bioreactor metagenome]|uniref:Uncharacterized protein n=1 Tax=bioreactor metagenome TaxID=1076179 RepID=A0A645BMN5_9ZZZZ